MSTEAIRIDVAGEPVAWSRPRPRHYRQRHRGPAYFSPHRETPWYGAIMAEAIKIIPKPRLDGPISMEIVFRMPRPAAHAEDYWHSVKPDRSNLEKLVEDALVDAGVIKDDARICTGAVSKRYVLPSEAPGATIIVSQLERTVWPG